MSNLKMIIVTKGKVCAIKLNQFSSFQKCSLPECTAENIPHTWQHKLKIAQKPFIHSYSIFNRQVWDPQPFWSRFVACNLLVNLKPRQHCPFDQIPVLTLTSAYPLCALNKHVGIYPSSMNHFRVKNNVHLQLRTICIIFKLP